MIIIKAHHLLEKHTLTKGQLYWKEQIAAWYGQQMHEAMYLDPVMRDMEAMMDSMEEKVSGEVEIQLMPYHFAVLGIKSEHDLMSSKFGSYGEVNRSFTGQDVVGFTKVLANPLKIFYAVNSESAEDVISK
jgi:argininosuccinate synthase